MANEKYGSIIQININNNFNIEDAKKLNRYRLNLYYSSDTSGISLAPIYERISGENRAVLASLSRPRAEPLLQRSRGIGDRQQA